MQRYLFLWPWPFESRYSCSRKRSDNQLAVMQELQEAFYSQDRRAKKKIREKKHRDSRGLETDRERERERGVGAPKLLSRKHSGSVGFASWLLAFLPPLMSSSSHSFLLLPSCSLSPSPSVVTVSSSLLQQSGCCCCVTPQKTKTATSKDAAPYVVFLGVFFYPD